MFGMRNVRCILMTQYLGIDGGFPKPRLEALEDGHDDLHLRLREGREWLRLHRGRVERHVERRTERRVVCV